MKGDKAVVTNQDGDWQLASELEGGEGRGRFLGRMVRNFKTPAVQAADLAGVTKDLKKEGDVYSGELTEEGAKAQFRFGTASGAKGSVKFWVKDGLPDRAIHPRSGNWSQRSIPTCTASPPATCTRNARIIPCKQRHWSTKHT